MAVVDILMGQPSKGSPSPEGPLERRQAWLRSNSSCLLGVSPRDDVVISNRFDAIAGVSHVQSMEDVLTPVLTEETCGVSTRPDE